MRDKSLNSPAFLGSLANASFGVVQFLVISLYPILATNLNLTLADVILAFSVGSFCFMFASPFWARVSDFHGRQRIIGLGLLGLSFSFFMLIYLSHAKLHNQNNFIALLLSRIFYGLTASSIVTGVNLWWKDSEGHSAGKMLNHSMSLNVGRLLAPILVLSMMGNLKSILWTVGIITLVLGIIFLIQKSPKSNNRFEKMKLVFGVNQQIVLFGALFIGLIHANLSPMIMESFKLSENQTALLTSRILILSSVITLLTQFMAKKLNVSNVQHLLKIGILCWIISASLFSQLSELSHLYFAVCFFSMGLALFMPGVLSLQKNSAQVGATNSLQTLGLSLGGVLGWIILQGYGQFPFIAFVLLIILFIMKRRTHAF